jgi:3-isopropylmalate/(R)-2-methylmalate dehydratase small subunit
MKQFGGKVLFLDRSDINTDEIIPAKYLTEISKQALKPHLLEDLSLPGFDRERDIIGSQVIVSRENFGCGSSREHAPWALEVNGITMVIAESFARIFRQNMYNGGMPAIELPKETIDMLFSLFSEKNTPIAKATPVAKDTSVSVDIDAGELVFSTLGLQRTVPFELSDFDIALVKAGGWVEFADAKY